MSSSFILDSSVAVSWFLEDENRQQSRALDGLARSCIALVPPLWFYEVANALVVAEMRARLPSWETARILKELFALNIEVDSLPTTETLMTTVLVSKQFSLASYDATYLELALRHEIPLATHDKRLEQAAAKAGVVVIS